MPSSSKFSPIDLGLTDRVALITAGANGIGEGSAIALGGWGFGTNDL
jgi:hypothetical protein